MLTETLQEMPFLIFFKNFSYQALNKENDDIHPEFTDTSNLIITLINQCLDKDNESFEYFNFNQKALQSLKEKMDNYWFPFDLPLADKVQNDVTKIMRST